MSAPQKEFQPWAKPETLKSMTGRSAAEEAELELWRQWMSNSDDANTQRILAAMNKTIESALTTYAPDHRTELRPRAQIIALQALKRFDPNRGVKPSTHVFNNLKTLSRVSAERFHVIHIPEMVRNDQRTIYFASQRLADELGREPTVEELADKTGLSVRRIEKLRRKPSVDFSESSALSEKGDTLFTKSSDPQRLWTEYVYAELDPIDKKIYEWSTGYGGTEILSKGEISRRLNISAPAVSQRVNKIIKKLEEGYSI